MKINKNVFVSSLTSKREGKGNQTKINKKCDTFAIKNYASQEISIQHITILPKKPKIFLFICFFMFLIVPFCKNALFTLKAFQMLSHTKAQSVFRSPELLVAVFVVKLSSYVEIFFHHP